MTTLTVITGTVTLPQSPAPGNVLATYRLQVPFSALDGASFVPAVSSIVPAVGDTSGYGFHSWATGTVVPDAAETYEGVKAVVLQYLAPNGPADMVLNLVFASDTTIQNLTYTEI